MKPTEQIAIAYGEEYTLLKDHIETDGWINCHVFTSIVSDFQKSDFDFANYVSYMGEDRPTLMRPKSLREDISQMQPEWVECSDRLPESMSDVICHLKNGYVTQLTYGERSRFFDSLSGISASIDNPVIHWMPLPQPPKE